MVMKLRRKAQKYRGIFVFSLNKKNKGSQLKNKAKDFK
jgi:hypothetical protein